MRIAVYPGSFDPITNGHLDVILRAARMFDRLVVAVLNNSSKSPVFSVEERVGLIRRSIPEIEGCEIVVDSFDGLLANYADIIGATTIVKGLRAMSDFEYEFQMAMANRHINNKLDTIFLTTSIEYMYLSSSFVRELGHHGGDITGFVPEAIKEDVFKKLYRK